MLTYGELKWKKVMQRLKLFAATNGCLRNFIRSSEGAQAIEYAIIGALGAVTIVWAMDAMAPELQGMLNYATEMLKDFGKLF